MSKKYKLGKIFIRFTKRKKNNFKIFAYKTNYVRKGITFQIPRVSFTVGISE